MASRSYRQYCAFARALDALGDRWTLLIVRNLLLGPQTWSELRDGLPGIAKNLLSDRLKHLAEDGVVAHIENQYTLTERGAELETVVFALGNWGERHFMGPPSEDDAFRLRYLMTSIRRKLRSRADDSAQAATLQVIVDDAPFWISLGADATVEQGTSDADATIRCPIQGFQAIVFGRMPVDELLDRGLIEVEGSAAVISRFQFALGR